MEVAREKPLAPTIFDVIAPRSSQTSTGSASFRDCLVPPSSPSSANSPGTGTSATASRPPEPASTRDARPAHKDRDTKHDSSNRAPQAKNEPARPPSTDGEGPAKTEDDTTTSAEVSKTTAEQSADAADKSESSSEATTAAEVLAAAQATMPKEQQPALQEMDQGSDADAAKATTEADEAKEEAKSKAGTKVKGAAIQEPAAVNSAPASDMMTTAEVVSARVVENEIASEAGEKTESAEIIPSDALADANAEAAPPEQATSVADASAAVAVVPTAVQAIEPGKQGENQKDEKPGGEHAAKVAKKGAEGEALNAQHAAKAKTTVADAPPSALVADDSELREAEQKAEVVNARGTEAVANKPAAVPVAADPAIPNVGPPGAEAAATSSATDLPIPAESNSATNTNDAPPAAPTAPPRVPPALLRKADSHHSTHERPGEIDPARFLTRVVKAFESAQQRDNEVRLRLHPAELGSLSIEVKVQDSALTARLQAETPEARTALLDNLPMLRERLADQGIRIEKFDVDLMDHSDRQPQQSPSEQRSDDGGRRSAQARGSMTTTKTLDKEIKAPSSVRSSSAADRLNVVI